MSFHKHVNISKLLIKCIKQTHIQWEFFAICLNVFILADLHLLLVVNNIFPLPSWFFYCEESKQTLLLISNVHISCIYHPNIETCTAQLFVNWGILPVLAYKPLEWKSQVMFWRIWCSTLWLVLWPHHTITDFEIAPPWLFQWQWSELCWCAYARVSCDRWSSLLICDDMLRDLLQDDMKSHFANSFGQLFHSCYLAVLGLGIFLTNHKVQMSV